MGLLKACSKCKIEKPLDAKHFRLNKYKANGLDSWCRDCANAYKKSKGYSYFSRGIKDIKRAQEAKELKECIICGEETKIVVDHDHETGYVRGGLCTHCNLGLGHFMDNPELLRLAALYLEGSCECGECETYWGAASERQHC